MFTVDAVGPFKIRVPAWKHQAEDHESTVQVNI